MITGPDALTCLFVHSRPKRVTYGTVCGFPMPPYVVRLTRMSFLVSPAELDRRRARCRPVVESLSTGERQFVPACNVCGSPNSCVIAYKDRYGMPLRTAMCMSCGLVYLMDRLTQQGYSDFYRDGAYRKLTSSFAGSVATMEDLQADQGAYAKNVMSFLEGRLARGRN